MRRLTETARLMRCVTRACLPIYERFNSFCALCALRWLTVFIRLKPVVVDLSGQLLPLPMQHKSGPEVGRRPAFLFRKFKLSRPQGRPRRHTVFEHTLIKKLHQLRRR
jgi:hypothetical protein